jgi:hypothetical protein
VVMNGCEYVCHVFRGVGGLLCRCVSQCHCVRVQFRKGKTE